MNTTFYTNGIVNHFPVDQSIPARVVAKPVGEDSSADVFSFYPGAISAPQVWWLPLDYWEQKQSYFNYYNDGFIGILNDDEARGMKAGINLFRKRFDDDLARRNKILFGE
jgi:hypothetical protein